MDIPLPETAVAKMNFSKDAFGFEEILSTFKNSERVVVATYHLDLKPGSKLLERLRKLPNGARVTLVTSVPGRWDHYKNSYSEARAKYTIEQYLAALHPKEFSCSFEPWFCFQNHAKIVATDSVLYIGSQNFADTSRGNFECGVVIRCPDAISSIVDPILKQVLVGSERHFGHIRGRLLILIRSAGSSIGNLIAQVDGWKSPVTAYGGDIEWELDPSLAALNPILPDSLGNLAEDIGTLYQDLLPFEELAPALESFPHEALETLSGLSASDELEKFARYDPDKWVAGRLAVCPPHPDDMDAWHAESMEDEREYRRAIECDAIPEIARLENLLQELIASLRKLYRAVKSVPAGAKIDNTSTDAGC